MTYDAEHDIHFENHPHGPDQGWWPDFCRMKFRCWWSKYFWDVHDYHIGKGGDGIPTHFHEYTCQFCNKKFRI
jgi:alpha-glucosidase (family GH31 glycosyl hydrolase)